MNTEIFGDTKPVCDTWSFYSVKPRTDRDSWVAITENAVYILRCLRRQVINSALQSKRAFGESRMGLDKLLNTTHQSEGMWTSLPTHTYALKK